MALASTLEPVAATLIGTPLSAVVDVGSNSVRLVVFDGPARAPTPMFNEKVLCGLGRDLAQTGKLHEEGVRQAQAALKRFVALTERMRVSNLKIVATAAVREASNGAAFVTDIERRCGVKVRILTGSEEAELSALGVVSGIPDATGLMGDLGGGSLELVGLDQGEIGKSTTLPLGPLRLVGLSPDELRAQIDKSFAEVKWLENHRGRSLYLVGGAWRAVARIHMAQHDYPLRIIQDYRIGAGDADDITRLLAKQSKESLLRVEGVPRRRLETIAIAALTLRRLIKRITPKTVVFSAHGLREGICYVALSDTVKRQDALLAACRDMAAREGRFAEHGDELAQFLAPLFAEDGPKEARLRLAAALLSDIAWRVNPDYRGEQAFRRVLRAPFAAINHQERAMISLAVFARYKGDLNDDATLPGRALINDAQAQWALRLGLTLRLAHALTGGTAGLQNVRLDLSDKNLVMKLPPAVEPLLGEAVQRRFEALAKVCSLNGSIEVVQKKH